MRPIPFPLISPAAFSEQAVLTPDTLERVVADGEIKFADQTTGTASGQRFAELDQLRFPLG
jgi:hypothetical protein